MLQQAIVRGKLTNYDEQVTNFDPNTPGGRITTNQTRVQITFDAEIFDVKGDKVIWQQGGISAIGLFSRERGETADVGRRKAMEEGMITLRGSGLRKVKEGVTTIEEVVRETVK